MNKLIRFSVENNNFSYFIITLLIAFGWLSFQSLPIDAVPDITDVQVQVNTDIGPLSPDTAEMNVTYAIESTMGSVPGVKTIRSITRFGISQVTVVFKEGTDIYLARQLVSEKLQSVDLPEGMKPELGPISTGLGEVFFYTIEAKEIEKDPQKRLRQLMELRSLQEWSIKPRLLLVPGVAEINAIGGYPKQVFIKPKIDQMAKYGLDFETIVKAIKDNGFNTGGGYIAQTAEQVLVQGSGLYKKIQDIKEVPVLRLQTFETITVGDVTTVEYAKENRTGAATVNGSEAIVCTAFMLLGENSRTVSSAIQEAVVDISDSLPEWVELNVIYNRSDLVNATIETVIDNLAFGAILVLIILLLLVGNIRAAVITAFTIPMALFATLIAMKLGNVSGNLMSLGALDFGIIIDGAVIVMDSCISFVRKRSNELGRDLTRNEIKEAVIEATINIRQAAGFGQIIIAIVFLPLLAFTGTEGKMFKPMAITFFFALIAAFCLAFTVVPSLAGSFLSGRRTEKGETRLMTVFHSAYRPLLRFAFKNRKPFLGGAVLLLILSGLAFSRLGSEFIPKLYEGSLAIQFVRPVNINLEQSIALQNLSEQKILEFEEVEVAFARIGTAEIATDPMGVNLADTFIMLKPEEQWPEVDGHKRTKDELVAAIGKKLQASIPGQRILMTQPIEMRFNELLEGVRGDISIKIFGPDLKLLEAKSQEIVEILRRIDGLGEAESELQGTSPILNIKPKMNVLNQYGVSKSAVLHTVQAAIGGEQSNFLYDGVIKYPIVVRLDENLRQDIQALARLPVGIETNFTVPLGELADFNFAETYGTIKRETSQRRVAVMINLVGRDTQSFVEEAKEKVAANISLPSGYYYEWGGSFKNLQSAKDRLFILAPVVLLIIILMIYSAFTNWVQVLLVLLGIPFALIGGAMNLFIFGLPFSISAGVGFIALSGVAVLNSIVLVSVLNNYKANGETGIRLIELATEARLRAILMTALTDILGFFPMMLATSIGAEVQRPLATVVVGGIFTSTLLTLIILPLIYNALEHRLSVGSNETEH